MPVLSFKTCSDRAQGLWPGIIPVIAWGALLPLFRKAEQPIGALLVMGVLWGGASLLGFVRTRLVEGRWVPQRRVFSEPAFYGRWLFFVLHEGLAFWALSIVHRGNITLVIFLNYLWPTFSILFSIPIAGMKVRSVWACVLGCALVIFSLSVELLGPGGLAPERFANLTDRLAYGMVLAGAISWGLYSALSVRYGETTGKSAGIPLFQLTLAVTLPLSFVFDPLSWTRVTGPWAAFLALFCVVLFAAYLSWDFGMRKGNSVGISLMADFIPAFSLFGAWRLLGEIINPQTIVAGVLLITGAMLTRWGTLDRTGKSQAPVAP